MQNKKQTGYSTNRGFTLLEMITVLIILGIIAVVAVAKYRDTGADDLAAANTLKAHLRYAQLRAMGDIVPWGIEIEADRYTLKKVDENGVFENAPVNLPGENSQTKDDLEVSLSPETIIFSAARGQPIDSDENLISGNQIIDVGSTQTITITPETGFIE